jgi:ABC-type uncharacterized transport system substrate-binding protein
LDRPVVFATVANPFVIKAGTSDTDHLPNITGVYGWVPMNRTLEIVTTLLPGKRKFGCIWDQAQANSVFNAENLQKEIAKNPDLTFVGANISGSSEEAQAAASLVQKDIDAFMLTPDNTVYSALEAVVKAARARHIPIFVSDVERLGDGAVAAYGYDYSISGIQTAHLVDRILKGEDPAKIPFERYSRITFGINLAAARECGLTVPPALLKQATTVVGGEKADAAK